MLGYLTLHVPYAAKNRGCGYHSNIGGEVTLCMYAPGPKSDMWVESMSGGGTLIMSMSSGGGTK